MADTNRLVLSIAKKNQGHVYQMDVKYAFLNGILEENFYADEPPRYTIKGHEDIVLKIKNALYGLKQAP